MFTTPNQPIRESIPARPERVRQTAYPHVDLPVLSDELFLDGPPQLRRIAAQRSDNDYLGRVNLNLESAFDSVQTNFPEESYHTPRRSDADLPENPPPLRRRDSCRSYNVETVGTNLQLQFDNAAE